MATHEDHPGLYLRGGGIYPPPPPPLQMFRPLTCGLVCLCTPLGFCPHTPLHHSVKPHFYPPPLLNFLDVALSSLQSPSLPCVLNSFRTFIAPFSALALLLLYSYHVKGRAADMWLQMRMCICHVTSLRS